MMHIRQGLVRCSGDRWMKIYIPSISLVLMLGGWMPVNLMCETVLRCGIVRLCADLQPWVPLPNISMPILS